MNVQGNKKSNTQNIQIKKQKKTFELFFVDKPKRSHRVDYSAMAKSHQAKESRYIIGGVTY